MNGTRWPCGLGEWWGSERGLVAEREEAVGRGTLDEIALRGAQQMLVRALEEAVAA